MTWLKYYFKCAACPTVKSTEQIEVLSGDAILLPTFPEGWQSLRIFRDHRNYEELFYCPDHDIKIEIVEKGKRKKE